MIFLLGDKIMAKLINDISLSNSTKRVVLVFELILFIILRLHLNLAVNTGDLTQVQEKNPAPLIYCLIELNSISLTQNQFILYFKLYMFIAPKFSVHTAGQFLGLVVVLENVVVLLRGLRCESA